jgi:hypothetical protein
MMQTSRRIVIVDIGSYTLRITTHQQGPPEEPPGASPAGVNVTEQCNPSD